jgi:hypothetical protein
MILSLILTAAVIDVHFLANMFEFEHISLLIAIFDAACVSVYPIVRDVKLIERKLRSKKV